MRKFISLLLIMSMCFALVSCALLPTQKPDGPTDGTADEKPNNDQPIQEKPDDDQPIGEKPDDQRPTVTLPVIDNDKYEAFIDKLSAFAARLTYEVYSESEGFGNVCISPVSVYMALALATECSSGETREELLDAVGVTYDEVDSFTGYLYLSVNREYYNEDDYGGKQLAAFGELANSIWTDRDIIAKDECLSELESGYGCEHYTVDYEGDEANKAINEYIKKKTHGIIDANVNLPPETLITIINTFYLKEIWNAFGDELSLTENEHVFKNADGSLIPTKLLKGYYADGKVIRFDGFSTFFIRTAHGYMIKLLVPDEGRSLDEVFTPENLCAINDITDYGYVDSENKILNHTRVFFPEFEASFDGDLAKIMREKFGVNSLFVPGVCNFSGITDESVSCAGIIHKCNLEVNKQGIEGAAVTFMPMAGDSMPDDTYEKVYYDFIVDRAFGFVLTNYKGEVLFSGAVNGIN